MNSGGLFRANKIKQNLNNGICEKTALFIESYNGQMSGNALAVLQGMLDDPQFADWTIRWTVLNADGMEDDLTGVQKDPRIELVLAGALRFIEALETSQLIISCPCLPEYYIKSKGQVVVGLFADYVYEPSGTINRTRAHLQQSLGKVDFLYIEGNAARDALKRWYPSGTPFKVMDGEPLRYALQEKHGANVILSLSNSAMGKLYADMEQRFRSIELICAGYDKTLFMRIPHARRMSYRQENAPEVLDRVGDDVFPICQSLQRAQAVVTDRLNDVRESISAGVPCVFFSNMVGDHYDLYSANRELLTFAGDWDEVCAALKSILESGVPAAYDLRRQIDAGKTIASLLTQMINACVEMDRAVEMDKAASKQLDRLVYGGVSAVYDQQQRELAYSTISDALKQYFVGDGSHAQKAEKADKNSQSTLFVLLSALDPAIMRALKYYKPSENVSVLYTSASTPEMWGMPLEERICLHVKRGKDYSDLVTPANEWRHILGNRTFDTVYVKTTTDPLWNQMYKYAPGKQVISISKNQLLKMLLRNMDNPLLRHYDWEVEPIKKIKLSGKMYYVLGEDSSGELYLRCKKRIERPILAFVYEPKDRERLEQLLDVYLARSCFLLDPDEHMKDSPLLQRPNVYWLPIKQFPVKLFLYAQTIMLCRDFAMVRIAEALKKKVVNPAGMELEQTEQDRWDLLDICSVEDILV